LSLPTSTRTSTGPSFQRTLKHLTRTAFAQNVSLIQGCAQCKVVLLLSCFSAKAGTDQISQGLVFGAPFCGHKVIPTILPSTRLWSFQRGRLLLGSGPRLTLSDCPTKLRSSHDVRACARMSMNPSTCPRKMSCLVTSAPCCILQRVSRVKCLVLTLGAWSQLVRVLELLLF
jgi:hypothetical protein